jgi:hypothetical protein
MGANYDTDTCMKRGWKRAGPAQRKSWPGQSWQGKMGRRGFGFGLWVTIRLWVLVLFLGKWVLVLNA